MLDPAKNVQVTLAWFWYQIGGKPEVGDVWERFLDLNMLERYCEVCDWLIERECPFEFGEAVYADVTNLNYKYAHIYLVVHEAYAVEYKMRFGEAQDEEAWRHRFTFGNGKNLLLDVRT